MLPSLHFRITRLACCSRSPPAVYVSARPARFRRVRAQAAAPETDAGGAGGYASRKYRFLEKIDYSACRLRRPYQRCRAAAARRSNAAASHRDPARRRFRAPPFSRSSRARSSNGPNADDVFHNVFICRDDPVRPQTLQARDSPKKGSFPKTAAWRCSVPSTPR